MKKKWSELSLAEQEEWNKVAREVNSEGLADLFAWCEEALRSGLLVVKDGELMVAGDVAYSFFQEKGIPPDVLLGVLNMEVGKLLPGRETK